MDSCAVCALHKLLGQGGKKELELCTQPGPPGGSAQGGEGHFSVISKEVPYSLAVTLGLGKEKRESGKDNLYRRRQLPSQPFTSLSSPRSREAGSCAVCLLGSLALTLGQALGALGISEQPSLICGAWEGGWGWSQAPGPEKG